MRWTCGIVWGREIEAQDTIWRLPGDRIAGLRASWPAFQRSFADAAGAEETRAADGYPWAPGWRRPPPPEARAIDRMQEVWSWHARFLSAEPHVVRVLQAMARAAAHHRPLLQGVSFLRQRRWTAYRTKDRALRLLANGLNATGVPLVQAE